MLNQETTALIVIDIQERLARAMFGREELVQSIRKLIKGAQVFPIPIVLTEQNPEGLGSTIAEIAGLLPDVKPIPKVCFNCCDSDPFVRQLERLDRKQLLLAGIEAHVCVYQTAVGLIEKGYEVQVVADAVSSRTTENREIGLDRARQAGAGVTSVETALFELLRVAEGDRFQRLLKIVK